MVLLDITLIDLLCCFLGSLIAVGLYAIVLKLYYYIEDYRFKKNYLANQLDNLHEDLVKLNNGEDIDLKGSPVVHGGCGSGKISSVNINI